MTDDALCDRPAVELAGLLRTGQLAARELLTAQLARIAATNPSVNAIVTLDPDRALAEAARADDRLAAGEPTGPLHGLAFAFKDTHATAGMRTTWGSSLLADNVPEQDELLVERIRAAGALTLGKTNVPEFAAGSHTFNRLFGATRNPYDLSRSAGGSSGGAAAALAAGMVPLADGSDMGGSLRNPASFCNVVGLRPSPGRVPRWPAAAPWDTLSVQGPMGRTVADVALLLSVLAGPDGRSPTCLSEPGALFAAPLARDLTGLRVAWSPDLGGHAPADAQVLDVLLPQLAAFEELGAHVEPACLDFGGADEVFRTLRAWLFELSLGELSAAHPGELKPSLADNIELGRRLTGPEVSRALALQTEIYHRARLFFTRYDVLLLPTSQVAPFDVGLEYPTVVAGQPQRDYLDWMRSSYLVTVTGSPALSVPAGFTADGLPVGLQIVGPHRSERVVLDVGYAFEQARPFGRRRPRLPPLG